MKYTLLISAILVLLFSIVLSIFKRREPFIELEDISGAWKKTCSVPMLDGNKLTASCKNNVGTITVSSIDVSNCKPGSITNKKGFLGC